MDPIERVALAALFRATDGANWRQNYNWNTDPELSTWCGVEVNNEGSVVKLLLSGNDLKGPMPKKLGALSELQELHISGNHMTGPIPEALGALSELRELDLSKNKLSGIPKALGALSELKELCLSSNKLTGGIPDALGGLTKMEVLSLDTNELAGPVPEALGALSELSMLHLFKNNLTGPIPKGLGALGELQRLSLYRNKFTGGIPESLGALAKLQILHLQTNELTGPIPGALGALSELKELYLQGNKLSGSIPEAIGALGELQKLRLSRNKLTGDIPEAIGALTKMQTLSLHNNELTGPVPAALGSLSKLTVMYLASNRLTEIPQEVLEMIRRRPVYWSWVDNPWARPPSTVIESGVESALGWWEDVKRYGEGKSNKLKMVLVGLAEAGKTTIVRHFTGQPVPNLPDRTVGIEITPNWRPVREDPLQVSVWDFAGQADYYSSHQLFLTRGALFLLVVDLRTFFEEVRHGGVDNFTDRRGRIYWWLDMLNMRVPGAAVALVGSHADLMESADADIAGILLHTVVRKYIQDKSKSASKAHSVSSVDVEVSRTTEMDLRGDTQARSLGSDLTQRSGSNEFATKPLVLHDHVFKVTLARESVGELQEWIVKAAYGQECPPEFNFPAVHQAVSKAWVSAYRAMDALRETSPCVLWSKAVEAFIKRMRRDSDEDVSLLDAGKVFLRAMNHREAEGGVLLSLTDSSAPVAADMLHLDPPWLIELVRRVADHNLVDKNEKKQGTLRSELREYASQKHVELAPLWDMHRTYSKSGHVDQAYLRFLWMHRKIDPPGPTIILSDPEFESIVSTMVRLLVMYRSRGNNNLVVAPRLPQYGDQRVLDPGRIEEVVVKMECSFGQVYPPPGIIGRFLAWSTNQVYSYDECWQHGAFFRYNYEHGQYKVFLYESEDEECHEDQTVKFAGLTFGVQGSPARAPMVLSELRSSLEQLVADSAFGYPGLKFLMSFGEVVAIKSTCLGGLRSLLDNVEDVVDRLKVATASLEETSRKLGGVVHQLVEQELLATSAGRKGYPYPRLVIVVPDGKGDGAQERIQRVGWDSWTKAWKSLHLPELGLHHNFRLRFLCEHDLAEVPCGPDGRGYPIEKLKDWVQNCIPLMKASLWILRAAVGTVSNVDLPLNEVLGGAVQATGAELLEGMGTEIPSSIGRDPVPDFTSVSTAAQKELQGTAYEFLCEFMRKAEPTRRCVCFPCRQRPTLPVVNWKDSMVQVRNGRGGWAWVLKENEEAYLAQQGAAPAAPRPPTS